MSFGKSGGSSTTIPEITPEQRADIKARTDFFQNTIAPTYREAVGGATDLYNRYAPGYNAAAQDYGRTAGQAGSTLGETGESALRTGVSGLENLFGKDYENQQIQAALAPAQGQYMQNLANQQAQYGGTGQLGSARDRLASQQLAGMNAMNQANIAAQVGGNIAGQRAAAAGQLSQIGQGGLNNAINAYGARLGAAGAPQDFYNKYASIIFGTPSGSYTPNFSGTQGSTTNGSSYQTGLNLGSAFKFF